MQNQSAVQLGDKRMRNQSAVQLGDKRMRNKSAVQLGGIRGCETSPRYSCGTKAEQEKRMRNQSAKAELAGAAWTTALFLVSLQKLQAMQ